MMAAPKIYHDDRFVPFDDEDINSSENSVRLFYATDRSLAEDPQQWPYYQNARGHVLRLGQAEISMSGGDYSWDQIKEITLQRNRPSKYYLEISAIDNLGVLDLSSDYLDGIFLGVVPEKGPRLSHQDTE